VPIIGGFTNNGLQGVAFVPFGVQLQFTPYVVDRDRVRLSVNAEVSTRDEALGTSIGGGGAGSTQVSGISTRNFTSTVELREGQTLAVAGLIQNNFGSSTDRVPLWGDLPLIGWTGGHHRTSSGEQELVILITPELVHPLEACQTPIIPGSDVFEPGDIEFYLCNRLESRRSRDWRASVRTDYHRIRAGDKFCEDRFIIGPNGPTYGCCHLQGLRGGTCDVCNPPQLPLESLPPAIATPATSSR
jgi:pilus assembly protein CpaC